MSDEEAMNKVLADRYEIDINQVFELKETFSLFVEDKTGTVHGDKIPTLLRAQGLNPNETELQNIKSALTLDETGHITFEEYVKQASKFSMDPVEAKDRLHEAFKCFDHMGSGFVSAEAMRKLLTEVGDVVNQEEVEEFLADANVDNSGMINYEDFIRTLTE